MVRKELVVLPVCFGVLVLSALAQSERPAITIDKVMTEEEMRLTGMTTLTPGQRSAFNHWLTNYTLKVLELARRSEGPSSGAPGSHPPTYIGSSGGHWIKSKADNGAIIILEDGSMWGINPLDRIDTALWLPITDIAVLRASSPIGDYRYVLVNTDDGEKALAKYLGKQ